MKKRFFFGLALSGFFAVLPIVFWVNLLECQAAGTPALSVQIIPGFKCPESAAYDPAEKVLYVGQFGSELKPTLKDGKGKISKVSLSGKIIEKQFFPNPGEILHKPKGIWVENGKLWVTDIDVVWIVDLKTRQGRKVSLPGAKFANDPTVMNKILFVSDTGGSRIYKIAPADFLDKKIIPEVTDFVSELSFSPNGLYPGSDGSLLVVGYEMDGQDRGVYAFEPCGKLHPLSGNFGLLDGLVQLNDGSLLITDWKTKSLIKWEPNSNIKTLAANFMGPADFCVIQQDPELIVVVPDIVKNELQILSFAK